MSASAPASTAPSRGALLFFAVVALLVAAFFGYLAVDLAGTPICDEAQTGEECVEKSTTTKTLITLAAALTAAAALATAFAAFRCASGRLSYGKVRAAAVLTLIFAAITIIL